MAPKQTWLIFDPPDKLYIFTIMVLLLLHLLILKDNSATATQGIAGIVIKFVFFLQFV